MWDVLKLIGVIAGVITVLFVICVTVYAVREFRHATRDDD
jgi:uncharacterized membrane protein